MKTLISAVLALTLLGTAGASAQSWRGNGQTHFGQSHGYQDHGWQDRGYQNRGWQGSYRHDNRGNVDTQIGIGLGLFALGAILASQNQQHAPVYDSGYYGR